MKRSACIVMALAFLLSACATAPTATRSGRNTEQDQQQVAQLLAISCTLPNQACVPAITVSGGAISQIPDQHFYSANHLIFWTISPASSLAGWTFVWDQTSPNDASGAINFKTTLPSPDEFTCRLAINGSVLLCFNRHSVTGRYDYRIRVQNGSTIIPTSDPTIFND